MMESMIKQETISFKELEHAIKGDGVRSLAMAGF